MPGSLDPGCPGGGRAKAAISLRLGGERMNSTEFLGWLRVSSSSAIDKPAATGTDGMSSSAMRLGVVACGAVAFFPAHECVAGWPVNAVDDETQSQPRRLSSFIPGTMARGIADPTHAMIFNR